MTTHNYVTFNRGTWGREDDQVILDAIQQGVAKWSDIGKLFSNERTGKQCRERWFNHLDPSLKKGVPWTDNEDQVLLDSQKRLGNSWTRIALDIPGRSENEVKNRWYSAAIRKKRFASGRKRTAAQAALPIVPHGKSAQQGRLSPLTLVSTGDTTIVGAEETLINGITTDETVPIDHQQQTNVVYLSPDEMVSLEIAELFLPSLIARYTSQRAERSHNKITEESVHSYNEQFTSMRGGKLRTKTDTGVIGNSSTSLSTISSSSDTSPNDLLFTSPPFSSCNASYGSLGSSHSWDAVDLPHLLKGTSEVEGGSSSSSTAYDTDKHSTVFPHLLDPMLSWYSPADGESRKRSGSKEEEGNNGFSRSSSRSNSVVNALNFLMQTVSMPGSPLEQDC